MGWFNKYGMRFISSQINDTFLTSSCANKSAHKWLVANFHGLWLLAQISRPRCSGESIINVYNRDTDTARRSVMNQFPLRKACGSLKLFITLTWLCRSLTHIFPYRIHVPKILQIFLIARACSAELVRNVVRSLFMYILFKAESVVFAVIKFFLPSRPYLWWQTWQ